MQESWRKRIKSRMIQGCVDIQLCGSHLADRAPVMRTHGLPSFFLCVRAQFPVIYRKPCIITVCQNSPWHGYGDSPHSDHDHPNTWMLDQCLVFLDQCPWMWIELHTLSFNPINCTLPLPVGTRKTQGARNNRSDLVRRQNHFGVLTSKKSVTRTQIRIPIGSDMVSNTMTSTQDPNLYLYVLTFNIINRSP